MTTFEHVLPKFKLGQTVVIIHNNKLTKVKVAEVATSESLPYTGEGSEVRRRIAYQVQSLEKPRHKNETPYRWTVNEDQAHATEEDLIESLRK
jgi:hypothetical protein